MLRRKYMAFSLLTLVSILLGGLFYCNPVQANSTVFSDDFDDGDISDWTVTTAGVGTFEASSDTYSSPPYSVHMKSLGDSKATGDSPIYTLDLTKDYTVSFYFLVPNTTNHWFEVFNNHQTYLVIDSGSDLKCYKGTPPAESIMTLGTNQWYFIEIKAHPSSSSYDVYVNGTFKKNCSMWIHGGWENSFRIGDREDGTTDYGEAYWDDIYIYQVLPVGGIYIPANKLELLAPYVGLTILLAVAVMTVAYVKKRKRGTEINS